MPSRSDIVGVARPRGNNSRAISSRFSPSVTGHQETGSSGVCDGVGTTPRIPRSILNFWSITCSASTESASGAGLLTCRELQTHRLRRARIRIAEAYGLELSYDSNQGSEL